MALALSLGRREVGVHFVPEAVCFAHARPNRVTEQERVFGAPVHYGCPRNELVLARELLERPQRHAELRLLAILDRQLGEILSGLPEGHGFRDVVKRRVLDDLPERQPVVAGVARKLHMSARSLQRRLQSEGTSFAEVLSELRRDRALCYLQDRRISIGEVAVLLGFLDVTAFHRAFKRWTGTTPAEYRRR